MYTIKKIQEADRDFKFLHDLVSGLKDLQTNCQLSRSIKQL